VRLLNGSRVGREAAVAVMRQAELVDVTVRPTELEPRAR